VKRSKSINLAIVAFAVGAGIFGSLRPWKAYRDQRSAADRQTASMRSAEQDRAALLRKQAQADTPIGKEVHARELGYVRQGQQPADPR